MPLQDGRYEPGESTRGSGFAVSVVSHGVALALLAMAPAPVIQAVREARRVAVVAPPVRNPKVAGRPKQARAVARHLPSRTERRPEPERFALRPRPPAPAERMLPPATQPQIRLEAPAATTPVIAVIAPKPPPPRPPTAPRLGVFTETPRVPTPAGPPVRVESGGFAGAAVSEVPARWRAPAGVGGFETAGGVAYGRRGPASSGPVEGARFGDARWEAAPGPSPRAVEGGGFAAAVAPPRPGPRAARPAAEGRYSGVEILSKPRPAYNDEARRLRIEGVVLIEVLFGGSGNIQVLRVVRGLGHGLDESAVQAARNIRYRPAERDGETVDARATVEVTFLLAGS